MRGKNRKEAQFISIRIKDRNNHDMWIVFKVMKRNFNELRNESANEWKDQFLIYLRECLKL